MNDFFERLSARILGQAQLVQPRIPARFANQDLPDGTTAPEPTGLLIQESHQVDDKNAQRNPPDGIPPPKSVIDEALLAPAAQEEHRRPPGKQVIAEIDSNPPKPVPQPITPRLTQQPVAPPQSANVQPDTPDTQLRRALKEQDADTGSIQSSPRQRATGPIRVQSQAGESTPKHPPAPPASANSRTFEPASGHLLPQTMRSDPDRRAPNQQAPAVAGDRPGLHQLAVPGLLPEEPAQTVKPKVREQPFSSPLRLDPPADERPVIQIKIGRIELQAAPENELPAAFPPAETRAPKLSLENYLHRRSEGQR